MSEEFERKWPSWIRQIDQYLSVFPHFVISGNIRDLHYVPTPDVAGLCSTIETLHESLRASHQLDLMIVYDPSDGLTVFPPSATDLLQQTLGSDSIPRTFPGEISLANLTPFLLEVSSCVDLRIAFLFNYASRLITHPGNLNDLERDFFTTCRKIVDNTFELRPARNSTDLPYNPVFWLVDGPNDLPDWFVGSDEKVKGISVEHPSRDARLHSARNLIRDLPGGDSLEGAQFRQASERFVELTDGIRLEGMQQIRTIAVAQGISASQIADAVQIFKVGVHDNPWGQQHLRLRLTDGEARIGKSIKGQAAPIQKTLDIMKRSVLGLSGSQASSTGNRPRGVLFFAGPTGVGKTELAKAITKLIFDDEQAYIRFDMSEFSSEHSEARLIGAPPGYVGYDSGGELVNSVRGKPFCLILFDEIEKAHPRILDKFLQILEDGRLTDGRGRTVHFSEAVIVFTSNLGMYVEDERGGRRQSVTPEDNYEIVESRVRDAISDHFRFELQRPEILNRFGDNIVVFDFIRADIAEQIFEKMLTNVKQRVAEELELEIDFLEAAHKDLLRRCTSDLANGGRGIGNRLETFLINPLSRALFSGNYNAGSRVEVANIREESGIIKVDLI